MWGAAEKDGRMQMQRLFAQNGVSQRKRQPFTQTSTSTQLRRMRVRIFLCIPVEGHGHHMLVWFEIYSHKRHDCSAED
jgi:hypothetical protein